MGIEMKGSSTPVHSAMVRSLAIVVGSSELPQNLPYPPSCWDPQPPSTQLHTEILAGSTFSNSVTAAPDKTVIDIDDHGTSDLVKPPWIMGNSLLRAIMSAPSFLIAKIRSSVFSNSDEPLSFRGAPDNTEVDTISQVDDHKIYVRFNYSSSTQGSSNSQLPGSSVLSNNSHSGKIRMSPKHNIDIFEPTSSTTSATQRPSPSIQMPNDVKAQYKIFFDIKALDMPNSRDIPIIDWVHSNLKPSVLAGPENSGALENYLTGQDPVELHQAIQYYENGINFKNIKVGKDVTRSTDILFSWGTVQMAKFHFDKRSLDIWRDLLAFEKRTEGKHGNHVSEYLHFLTHLIREPEDVKLLEEKGIINRHQHSNPKVVDLIHKLYEESEGLSSGGGYLNPIYQSLDKHYHNKVRKWVVKIGRIFKNPCLLATIITTSMSLVSAAFAILKYFK